MIALSERDSGNPIKAGVLDLNTLQPIDVNRIILTQSEQLIGKSN